MDNGLNNKTMIYWIVGVVVVIALVLGFWYWGNKSKVSNIPENTNTEEINSEDDSVIRPTDTTPTTQTPTEKTDLENNFDYKG